MQYLYCFFPASIFQFLRMDSKTMIDMSVSSYSIDIFALCIILHVFLLCTYKFKFCPYPYGQKTQCTDYSYCSSIIPIVCSGTVCD